MQEIIIYADKGVSGSSLLHTFKCLQREPSLKKFSIKRLDSHALKTTQWEKQTALLVIPGGRDVFYHAELDGEGTRRIRAFVENGGSYLGICAGAYFASQSIEFEKGGGFEVIAGRSLGFFPGVAVGPALGLNKYRPDSDDGIAAAHVKWDEQDVFAFYNGGCFFQNAHQFPEVKILAHYEELAAKPAAIVYCPVGKGRALLTGVHLEYSAPYLSPDNPNIDRILPQLQIGEEKRSHLFTHLLQKLI